MQATSRSRDFATFCQMYISVSSHDTQIPGISSQLYSLAGILIHLDFFSLGVVENLMSR
jgi:hypothetical protein